MGALEDPSLTPLELYDMPAETAEIEVTGALVVAVALQARMEMRQTVVRVELKVAEAAVLPAEALREQLVPQPMVALAEII